MIRRTAFALLFFVATSALASTTVRGRVYAGDGRTPYPGVAVTILTSGDNGPTVYTDRDGMFYVPQVAPGTYHLQVTTPRTPKKRFPIVAAPKEYTDLAPVVVP